MLKEWNAIVKDVDALSEFRFPRKVINSEEPNRIAIFWDASKDAYGFSVYKLGGESANNSSRSLFSKVKVAPLKTKTLPTLELLAMFLAFKCLKTFLKKCISVEEVFVRFTESQVALSWIISGYVKTKNKFASNRVKDVNCMHKQFCEKGNLSIFYLHVPTNLNPADMITREISKYVFSSQMEFWSKGPNFI